MKKTVMIVIALLALIVCVIGLHLLYMSRIEGMSSADADIQYYAITNNQQSNIETQQAKIKPQINILKYTSPPIIGGDAYVQSALYANELIKAKYNIHIALLNKLRADVNTNKGTFITVVFEDDFSINHDDYVSTISKIIDKTGSNNFDFIIVEDDTIDGTLSKIDEYSIYNKQIYTYLINNVNVENILAKIGDFNNSIFTDRIIDLAKAGKLNVYVYSKNNL